MLPAPKRTILNDDAVDTLGDDDNMDNVLSPPPLCIPVFVCLIAFCCVGALSHRSRVPVCVPECVRWCMGVLVTTNASPFLRL